MHYEFHTLRTRKVYEIARAVGLHGEMLAHGLMVNVTDNLVARLNPRTGHVQVRDRWSGHRLFLGAYDRCFICAPTTLAENTETEHADVDLGDVPRSWIIELQDELKEVPA